MTYDAGSCELVYLFENGSNSRVKLILMASKRYLITRLFSRNTIEKNVKKYGKE